LKTSFLKKAAHLIDTNHSKDLSKVLVVIPSGRAAKFLINHLKELKAPHVTWLPKCLGINQLVEELSELKNISGIELLLKAYSIYHKKHPEETFDSFIKWGQTALNDFNEIDNYGLNSEKVFSDLKDLKEIEEWSFNTENLSQSQDDFNSFWQNLKHFKSDLDDDLKSEALGYAGLLINNAIHRVESGHVKLDHTHIYFLGLNAISKTEESLITALKEHYQVDIISDSDEYYHLNTLHEAGHFMRKQEKMFGIAHELTNELAAHKQITFLRSNTYSGMAKSAAELISSNGQNQAVVLLDESLLEPLLSALPETIDAANITMGYPLTSGLAWAGINKLLQIKARLIKHGQCSYSDFNDALNHTLVKSSISNAESVYAELNRLAEKGITYLNKSHISTCLLTEPELLKVFSSEVSEVFVSALQWLLETANNNLKYTSDFIKEQIFISYKYLAEVKKTIKTNPIFSETKYALLLIDQTVKNQKVDFYGEPFGGIQIMGLLETRALDFENIIFVGTTDALLPAVNGQNSLLPFELKIHYGLPTNKEKEAVFAYSFYRLLQRVKNATCIYVETEEGLVANERSRFLKQLEYEWATHAGNEIYFKQTKEQIINLPDAELIIPKTEDHLNRILNLFTSGVSASALNTFITCPADFYYRYICGLREPEKEDTVIHPSITGSILHDTLEALYKPYVDQVLTEGVIEKIKVESVNVMQEFIAEKKLEERFTIGENLLEYEVMKKKLKDFLNWESNQIKELAKSDQLITLISVEESYKTAINGITAADGKEVVFKGIIDRIDSVNGRLRIIDYKSGQVTSSDVQVDRMHGFHETEKLKSLQLSLYALMVAEKYPKYAELGFTAGNISLRKISSGLLNLHYLREPDLVLKANELKMLKVHFSQLINQMLDKSMEFYHNEESNYCDFCI